MYQLKGISFPFRIGIRGGVEMSIADVTTPQKIVEHYQQILGTGRYERSMEYQIFSQVEDFIFQAKSGDETMQSMLEYVIKDALNSLEPLAVVNDVATGLVEDKVTGEEMMTAVVNFTVLQTNLTFNTVIPLERGA